MRFTLNTELPKGELEINHKKNGMLIGSCFAQNMGRRLVENKFKTLVNPFGILYNPLSIATTLEMIVEGRKFDDSSKEIFFHNDMWHSILHHSIFSTREKDVLIKNINDSLMEAADAIENIDYLILTFGTAYVFRNTADNTVVGNCHKLAAGNFKRSLLTVSEIVETLLPIFDNLISRRKEIQIILTISPIRHISDGMHGNQVSKSTLILAIEELKRVFPDNIFYFPSYEIIIDELRDYRFFAQDMIHPSPLAEEYVWQCFADCYFSKETISILKEWEAIKKSLNHRPFNIHTSAYKAFMSQIVLKMDEIREKYPFFELRNEIEQCHTQLKSLKDC